MLFSSIEIFKSILKVETHINLAEGFFVIRIIKDFVQRIFNQLFSTRKTVKLGLYGPPNGGKSTLANRISKDWVGEKMSAVSHIPHETREVQIKEQIVIKNRGKELTFNLIDTPGIATKIDYEDFMKYKLSKKKAKTRAREATKGVR